MKNSTLYDIFQIAAPELYWVEIEWKTLKTKEDGSFSIELLLTEDINFGNSAYETRYVVTDDSIRHGCESYIQDFTNRCRLNSGSEYLKNRLDALNLFLDTDGEEGDIDAWAADAIVQHAILGEVVFS